MFFRVTYFLIWTLIFRCVAVAAILIVVIIWCHVIWKVIFNLQLVIIRWTLTSWVLLLNNGFLNLLIFNFFFWFTRQYFFFLIRFNYCTWSLLNILLAALNLACAPTFFNIERITLNFMTWGVIENAWSVAFILIFYLLLFFRTHWLAFYIKTNLNFMVV